MSTEALQKNAPPPVAGHIMRQIADDRSSLTKLSMKELRELAGVFVDSGAFTDVKSVAAAMVKIIAGAELGFSPMVSMTGIHFFQGKAEFSSTLKASLIKESDKYDYKVTEHTSERCSIEFFKKEGGTWVSCGVPVVYTVADAQRAGQTGANWQKYPGDMLFASCIRQGFRRHCADLLRGIGADEDTAGAETVDMNTVETAHAVEERSKWLYETVLKAGRVICTQEQFAKLEDSLLKANLPELEERLISATAKLHTVVIAKIGEKLQNEEAAQAFAAAHLPLNGDSDVDTLCKALETLETVVVGEVVQPTESTPEAPAIEAVPVHSTPEAPRVDPEPAAIDAEEPARVSGITAPLAPPPAAPPSDLDSATEDLRVSCQERLGRIPQNLFKDMIAGLPPVGSMTKADLATLDTRLKKVETGF